MKVIKTKIIKYNDGTKLTINYDNNGRVKYRKFLHPEYNDEYEYIYTNKFYKVINTRRYHNIVDGSGDDTIKKFVIESLFLYNYEEDNSTVLEVSGKITTNYTHKISRHINNHYKTNIPSHATVKTRLNDVFIDEFVEYDNYQKATKYNTAISKYKGSRFNRNIIEQQEKYYYNDKHGIVLKILTKDSIYNDEIEYYIYNYKVGVITKVIKNKKDDITIDILTYPIDIDLCDSTSSLKNPNVGCNVDIFDSEFDRITNIQTDGCSTYTISNSNYATSIRYNKFDNREEYTEYVEVYDN